MHTLFSSASIIGHNSEMGPKPVATSAYFNKCRQDKDTLIVSE